MKLNDEHVGSILKLLKDLDYYTTYKPDTKKQKEIHDQLAKIRAKYEHRAANSTSPSPSMNSAEKSPNNLDIDENARSSNSTFLNHIYFDDRAATTSRSASSTNSREENVTRKRFIPYPEIADPDFFQKLYNKKEFGDYVYPKINVNNKTLDDMYKERCLLNDFVLSKNQIFLKHFFSPFTPYNSLLLFHGVGVGKTCTAISIVEQYIASSLEDKKRKVIVLCPPNLIENFKKQLFSVNKIQKRNNVYDYDNIPQCTGNKYLRMLNDPQNMKHEDIQKQVNKIIKSNYKFYGFIEFANMVRHMEPKNLGTGGGNEKSKQMLESVYIERIKKHFSNTVIVIDEVHNVRTLDEKDSKMVPPYLMKVLTHAENVKLLLLSATPMFNDVTEITWLVNLLLANDKQPPLADDDVFNRPNGKVNFDLLRKSLKGRVSYMRGENPFTFPLRLSPKINIDDNVLNEHPKIDIKGSKTSFKTKDIDMISGIFDYYQKQAYASYASQLKNKDGNTADSASDIDNVDGDNEGGGAIAQKSVFQRLQHVSNIVFPSLAADDGDDGGGVLLGKTGFNSIFKDVTPAGSGNLKLEYHAPIVEKFGEILKPKEIGKYSAKMKNILNYVKRSDGIVFIFSTYIYSGVLPLAIALEHMGFNKYGNKNILSSSSSKTKPFKVNGQQATYCILAGQSGENKRFSSDFEKEIEALVSERNKNGEVIKVVLGTNVVSEGIDMKNIREVHILEPWYNLNKCEQIIGRAVRHCSHLLLPPEKRNVTVYHHVGLLNTKEESVDYYKYRLAIQKNERIKSIENLLKSIAIDCHFNKSVARYDKNKLKLKINVLTSQQKNQDMKVLDYAIGDDEESKYSKFKCIEKIDKSAQSTDDSTFNISFYDDEIKSYVQNIIQAFKVSHAYSFDALSSYVKSLHHRQESAADFDKVLLIHALNKMIDDRVSIKNNNDIPGIVVHYGKNYMFQPNQATNILLKNMRKDFVYDKSTSIAIRPSDFEEEQDGGLRIVRAVKKDKRWVIQVDAQSDDDVSTAGAGGVGAVGTSNGASGTGGAANNVGSSKQDVSQLLYKNVNDFLRARGISLQNTEYKQVTMDYFVDRLTKSQILNLLMQMKSKPDDTIIQSLIDAKLLHIDDKNTMYYVDIFAAGEEVIYKVLDSGLKKCSIADMNQLPQTFVQLAQPTNEEMANIRGFYINRENKFKMIRKGKEFSEGTECKNTSTVHKEELRGYIREKDPTIPVGGDSIVKAMLCEIYEIVLRCSTGSIFLRPRSAYVLVQTIKFRKARKK